MSIITQRVPESAHFLALTDYGNLAMLYYMGAYFIKTKCKQVQEGECDTLNMGI